MYLNFSSAIFNGLATIGDGLLVRGVL